MKETITVILKQESSVYSTPINLNKRLTKNPGFLLNITNLGYKDTGLSYLKSSVVINSTMSNMM